MKKQQKLPWIDRLNQVTSVAQLREALTENYPLIQPKKLQKIIVMGAAEEGERLLHLCHALNIEVAVICDDNPAKQGKMLLGHKIQSSTFLEELDKSIPVIIASHRVLAPIKALRAKGHKTVAPFALLQVLAPEKFPPHLFYENWLESLFNHRDRLKTLMTMLADEKSLQVLDAIVGFRLSLEPEILSPVIDWDLYGSEDILNLSNEEIYIDGGTYDGDTIKSFINRVDGKFKRIIGFEPDTGTFQKLQQNFSHEPRVEPINKGLFSHKDTLYFDNVGTRGSMLVEGKMQGISVPVTSVDEVLQGAPVTLIKMNIEGAEIPALRGAAMSIARYKPKLGISIYHRSTDLWEIPFLVKELHSQYQFYLRQHDGGVIESVLYAV
ncbi:MAG: hypothetical protein A3F10_06385 [Coxiella sp. RIFCSPHIGHO2_12_FULL_42_15]|nr:MAG: hypothetical protein A3F10_06385 [Coxiella sp. RIFCSPHIGHO2_12_FULL_42_15]